MSINPQKFKIKRGLTKLYKKSIIYLEDSVPFVWLRKQFLTIRKAAVGSTLKFFSKPAKLFGKPRRNDMTNIMTKYRGRFATTLATLVVATALAACGGASSGGSSVTPTPTPVPVAAPVLTIVSSSPLPVASTIVVASDKALENVTQVLVTTSQSTTLPGNAALSADKKSVIITMSNPLSFATVLTVTVKAVANGVEGSVTGTLTTEAAPPQAVCTPPSVFTAGMNGCVNPMGVTGYLNSATAPAGFTTNATFPGLTQSGLLPAACKVHGDACWKEATRNGTVEYSATIARDGLQPSRPVVVGLYKVVSTIAFPGQVLYCSKIFFADDGTRAQSNESVENLCGTWELVYQVGNDLGAILQVKNPTNGVTTCLQKKFRQSAGGWVDEALDSCF